MSRGAFRVDMISCDFVRFVVCCLAAFARGLRIRMYPGSPNRAGPPCSSPVLVESRFGSVRARGPNFLAVPHQALTRANALLEAGHGAHGHRRAEAADV